MDGDVISTEKVIKAPPDAIFALLADASRHPDIDKAFEVAERIAFELNEETRTVEGARIRRCFTCCATSSSSTTRISAAGLRSAGPAPSMSTARRRGRARCRYRRRPGPR